MRATQPKQTMANSPGRSRGCILLLSLAGTMILPVGAYLAVRTDFGSDSAGTAIASAIVFLIVGPMLLGLCTATINILAKRQGIKPSTFLRITRALPWFGGICILLLFTTIAPRGMITHLDVANHTANELRNIRITGLKSPLHLPQIGPTHSSGIGGDWGKTPTNLAIRWRNDSGQDFSQTLPISKPDPGPSRMSLTLILDETGTWSAKVQAE